MRPGRPIRFNCESQGVLAGLQLALREVPVSIAAQKQIPHPVVETPDVPAKCEIRMLMLWENGADRPVMVNNLARLSKGEMIGVRYNKGRDWVGGSVGFFY